MIRSTARFAATAVFAFFSTIGVFRAQAQGRQTPPSAGNQAISVLARQPLSAEQRDVFSQFGVRDAQLQADAAHAMTSLRIAPTELTSGSVKAVVGGRVEGVNPGNLLSNVSSHALFVTRSGDQATKFSLPENLRAAFPTTEHADVVKLSYNLAASTGVGNAAIHLAAVVASTTGLTFDASRSAYRGGFSVALTNLDSPDDHRQLDSPVFVSISAPGAILVDPAPLQISNVGVWHAVSIVVPAPIDPYNVEVSADPQDKGNKIELTVTRPVFQLIPASTHVIGWGIGVVPVGIRVQGYPKLNVMLQTEHGSVSPNSLVLDDLGAGAVSLRSDGATSTTVRVMDQGAVVASAAIFFDAPWIFLSAAVLGGLVGAFIRGKGRGRWPVALAIGVSSAILMTLLYAVGADWASRMLQTTQLATSGEAVVFVLGAIAALLGVTTLIRASS